MTLKASEDEQWAEFSVKDSGVGIPSHEIQRIFERVGLILNGCGIVQEC